MSTSKQERFMQAVAHDKESAKKVVPEEGEDKSEKKKKHERMYK